MLISNMLIVNSENWSLPVLKGYHMFKRIMYRLVLNILARPIKQQVLRLLHWLTALSNGYCTFSIYSNFLVHF